MIRDRALIALLVILAGGGTLLARRGPDRFDHPKHAALFPSCTGCHLGAVDSGAALLPDPIAGCASCHDGRTQRRVDWTPREGARVSNLRFDHATHPKNSDCLSCHAAQGEQGARWMRVEAARPQTCFACHGTRTEHLAQADSTCSTCHRALADLPASMTAARVGRFPAPPSHQAAGFGAGGGHATAARSGDRSCATCHARDFCAECHIAGAEVPSIAALAPDPRGTAIRISATAPATHRQTDFERTHAGMARASIQTCATCHAQPSCTACHQTTPRVASTLALHDPRVSDTVQRSRPTLPSSHRDPRWESTHGALAGARPASCAGCHARSECLECHRPDPGRGGNGYHASGFLVSHPAQAYGRQQSCAECHNTGSFCKDCHQQAGITAGGRLQGGFHDARQAFVLGHGQAARQSLESCVSCHAERDCLSCHSQTRGRGFNPHGPGFDPERLKRKSPGMCVACHAAGSV